MALGLQDSSVIPDSAFGASSEYGGKKLRQLARLHLKNNWVGGHYRLGDWVQVDLGNIVLVTKIATQGSYWNNRNYIKKYSIKKSFDGQLWEDYEEEGSVKVIIIIIKASKKNINVCIFNK